MFETFGSYLQKTVRKATSCVEITWKNYKESIRRRIPPLPQYADERDLLLKLSRSGPYLQQVLAEHSNNFRRDINTLSRVYDFSAATTLTFQCFASRYFTLSEIENVGFGLGLK